MADEHVLTITVEASGEVTPAPQPDAVEPPTEDEELTDG